ncbi:phosphoribosylanthranilate isomerase [Parabacteroides sp. PF5-5]|uniref:phosphoribosylanthranilate isomerase n=1 Tax=unclassified Parabacteroides TaxID=2649774 RepID=UPI002475CA9E|nr:MULTISPECIES: phosphoribosylanthranilate isomerase [unclassified Parabacteroides]MDH6305784.1 phosphoribosylanthranilate isomerase [Parabacteroides sp. PH5-39]MDH6317779.1 phosphoribosylanthranilate isomerase [Parabacteroides sp. PF5-13]MDH6320610.1 phosphoribosylanthranilate isomerase [Parabacteroides sp. PH5-13]MDH6324227.1 phosphoribosylanthranilate isomerase [Parabacteroides sp. PH5-8]MDH6328964.1 phosphoribosylanthranilate isomerase [Parabacteroides sp. PH5-41]
MIIKVCGMRDPENIRQLTALDINWIGFIFYDKSPRFFGIKNKTKPDEIPKTKIGVFVNASIEDITEISSKYRLNYIQLHGNESPDLCYTLHKQGYKLIKAFPVSTIDDLGRTTDYEGCVDYFLFDTKCDTYGGSGKHFDWSLLSAYHGKTPFILSGGIQAENIDAIRQVCHSQFAGIDLNSGFEMKPGIKDINKLSEFIKKVKTIK